jgi:hypothetical protein
MVTNCDIRTQPGIQAIERLTSIEDAIQLFENEKVEYPDLYPSGLQYIRFNDALFLGIDVEHLVPPEGQTHLTGGFTSHQILKIYRQGDQTESNGTVVESGGNVAKFLGLVARIHKYINAREAEKSFPGCRTVVASGLRKCFSTREGKDDFFSANFSVSTAFEAEKKGGSVGLTGNHLYVEDDIATAVSYCQPAYAILGFSKFIRTNYSLIKPYQYQHNELTSPRTTWSISDPINVDIMKKRHTFRRLNTSVLTNLQLFKEYQKFNYAKNEKLKEQIIHSFNSSTPSIEEVKRKEKITDHPFLSLRFNLDMDLPHFFGE